MYKYLGYEEEDFIVEQGDCMKTPSRIYVKLKYQNKEVEEVYVGGKAVILK